jgi:hypothetical protein
MIPRTQNIEYNTETHIQRDRVEQQEFDTGLDGFFDPAVDEHSAFYTAMELDKHAAHLVAGTSFLDLNTVILRTECNNAYESMNEADMQKLRTLMWDVYVPTMKNNLSNRLAISDDDMTSFQSQMYVVHLSVRVAQALQLIFELNQKKSFSAVAKTAYALALEDVLYHPTLKDKVTSEEYTNLINFLRRHPTYSTAFNTYVGYKLLQQQLVRGGGAGTNRKSNDAVRLHDEAANRLWSLLSKNTNLFSEFTNAPTAFKMTWHRLYYKEVADSLFQKLTAYSGVQAHVEYEPPNTDIRETVVDQARARSDMEHPYICTNIAGTASHIQLPGVNIVNAIQESRDTAAEGITKRLNVRSVIRSGVDSKRQRQ